MVGAELAERVVRGEPDCTTKSPITSVSAAPAAPTAHSVRPDHCRCRPFGTCPSGIPEEIVHLV